MLSVRFIAPINESIPFLSCTHILTKLWLCLTRSQTPFLWLHITILVHVHEYIILTYNVFVVCAHREAQNRPEGYHRTRTRRRQSSASAGALQQHAAVPSPAAKPTKPPPKVAWSPYDFEPVAHVPSHYHHQHHHHNQHQHQHQYQHERHRNHKNHQRALYSKSGSGLPVRAAVAVEEHVIKAVNGARPQRRAAAATTAAVVSSERHQQKSKNSAAATAATAAQEHTKNLDHQRYKRAKLASKKIHHHIHEHHHYHHYDYYIV